MENEKYMMLDKAEIHVLYYKTVIAEMLTAENAAVAQSVVRRIGSAEVTGPIPVSSLEKALISQGFFVVKNQKVIKTVI